MTARMITLSGRVKENKGRQFVDGAGHYSDGFSEILRLQQYGFASVPVAGSRGIVIPMGNNADQGICIGGDHPGHYPAGMPGGSTALYDASGNVIKLIGTGLVVDVPGKSITITAGDWTLTGNATINGNLHVDGDITSSGANPNHHSH